MNSTPVAQAPAVPDSAEDAGPVGNVIDQATANLIARVNAVSVTVEELMLAAAAIHEASARDVRPRGANSLSCPNVHRARLQGVGGKSPTGSDGADSQVWESRALGLTRTLTGKYGCRTSVLSGSQRSRFYSPNNESYFDARILRSVLA